MASVAPSASADANPVRAEGWRLREDESTSPSSPLPPAAAAPFSGRLREGANDLGEIADVLPRLSQMGYGHEVFTILAAAMCGPRDEAEGLSLRSVFIDVDRVQSYLARLSFGPRKRTLLMAACWQSRIARVRELVETGARLEAQDENGNTALSWAASGGNTEIIAVLLDRGARLEHRSFAGVSPLSHACWEGQAQAIELLLSRGANIASCDNLGESLLHDIVRNGKPAAINLLVRLPR